MTRASDSIFSISLLRNLGWLSLAQMYRMLAGFLGGILIVRYLGPELFGKYAYVMAVLSLLAPLISFGSDKIILRELAEGKTPMREVIGTALSLRFAVALLFFTPLILVAVFNAAGDRIASSILLAAGFSLLFAPKEIFYLYFQGEHRSGYASIAEIAGATFILVGYVACVVANTGVAVIATVFSLHAAFLFVVYVLLFCRATTGGISPRPSAEFARRLLKESLPLIVSSLSVILYARIDQVMLEHMKGSYVLGEYAAAARVAEAWIFFPMFISNLVIPGLMAAKDGPPRLFDGKIREIFLYAWVLSLSLIVPCYIFSDQIIRALFGVDYMGAAPVFAILVWGGLFSALGALRTSYMVADGSLRYHPFSVILAAVINVVLNILLIPGFGGIGAAIATVVSYWFAAYGSCFVFPPLRRVGLLMTPLPGFVLGRQSIDC